MVMDGLNELQARELCLECTTKVNNDFRSQNAQLTSKLESKLPWPSNPWFVLNVSLRLTLFQSEEYDAELNALKAMVENMIAFFYLSDFSTITQAPQMLVSLLTSSREIILTNMKQSVSLTLEILKSLYP
jgi:hypothetical protein